MHQITSVILFFVAILHIVNAMPTPGGETQNPSVMCKLPEVRGNCRALLPRWRYDPATKDCREFKFGGCAGNGNNFETYETCMKICNGI